MEKKLNQITCNDKGMQLELLAAVKEIKIDLTANGKEYLRGTLQTKDGEIDFKKWKITPEEKEAILSKDGNKCLGPGMGVATVGKIDTWNGNIQYVVDTLRMVTIDPNEFICTMMRSEEALKKDLAILLSKINSEVIKAIMVEVIKNAGDDFWIWCAAKSMHHAETRGLATHTISVMKLCDSACDVYDGYVNKDIVLCAALFHDIGKLKEMKPTALGNGEYVADAILGHIFMGAELAMEYYHNGKWDYETARQVAHCVLAHHGKLENGSPVEPATAEAAILAECDNMDAQVTRILTKSLTMTLGQYKDKVYKPNLKETEE